MQTTFSRRRWGDTALYFYSSASGSLMELHSNPYFHSTLQFYSFVFYSQSAAAGQFPYRIIKHSCSDSGFCVIDGESVLFFYYYYCYYILLLHLILCAMEESADARQNKRLALVLSTINDKYTTTRSFNNNFHS